VIGQRISHYQVVEKLGEGGMGVVYKARDTHLDRFVAIKVLPPEKVTDAERKRRFVQEAKAASALNHPNIITIHDIAQEGGVDFIVMEYVAGKTLDRLIPRKGLGLSETLHYAIQATDALAKAHAAGIVHRDLKPSNIMVTEDGLVKILDFGLAKLTEPVESGESAPTVTMTEEGKIVGTVAYMSPEQAAGKKVDARSDIFSFGSVLYEMVTGARAFQGDSSASTLAAVLTKEPKPPSQVVEGLPRELERVILRCLRKDPARRFQIMADLKVELEEVKVESDSQISAAEVPARGRRWLLAAAVAVPLLGVAGWFLLRQESAPVPPPSVVPLTSYTGSELYPSFSPDGNQVAFSWDGEKQDNFDIYVKLVGSGTALRLTTDPAPEDNPAWSPDGRQIAFVRQRGNQASVYLISPLGGAERKLADFRLARQPSISWSPDGKWLAVAELEPQEKNGIFLIPVERGERRRLTSNSVSVDHSPAFSPDGRFLAYASCSGWYSCDVHLAELGPDLLPKGQPRRLTHQGVYMLGIAWTADGQSLVYAAARDAGFNPYLWRVATSGTVKPERLELAGPQVRFPAISRVGNRLAYVQGGSDRDIWKFEAGGAAKNFISSTLFDSNPQFSPDGKRIAFASNRAGGAIEIWVCNQDGSNPVQLTNGLGRHQAMPRWSPDGRWIVFTSQGEDGHWDIYVIDAAGGQPRRITPYPSDEGEPSWSRDGKSIYFTSNRSGKNEIWRIPAAGGESVQVTDNGGYRAFESWDGKTLYYTKDPGLSSAPLFAKPLAGGPERQVLDSVVWRAFFPVENGIYHIARADKDGAYPLQLFDFATGESRLLTRIEAQPYLGLTVSPDRKTVLFTVAKPINYDLMLIENFR
jgi:Tol biopolymer transport system component/predicted Ser/Thr protein kinase